MSLLTIHFPSQREEQIHLLIEQFHAQLLMYIHSTEKRKHRERQQPQPVQLAYRKEMNVIIVEPQFPQFQLLQHSTIVYELLAKMLGAYIVEHFEEAIILSLIKHRCEKNNIIPSNVAQYCYNILNHNSWEPLGKKFTEEDRNRRSNKIADEIKQHFELNVELNLEGFIKFRMESYKNELREVVEYALDEYILDQQYEEFITLLKYFVQLQETKMEVVHLVQQDGSSFELCDDMMRPLELKHEHDRIVAEMLETEINIEDIVISSLISASPQKIMIHAKHNDYQVVRTVKTIFGERAQLCTTCPMCRTKQDEIIPFQ